MVQWSPHLRPLLADGEWHGIQEILDTISPYVRPEVAFRIGLGLLDKRRRDDDVYNSTDVQHLVRTGMVHMVSTALFRHFRSGYGMLEARGWGPTREYRFHGGVHPCASCGVDVPNVLFSYESYCKQCRVADNLSRLRPSVMAKRLPDIQCPHCGKTFHPQERNQRYCSISCAVHSPKRHRRPA